MQVSWIDPDEIAKLAAQLEGPLQRDEPAPWDLDTLPDISQLFTEEEYRSAEQAQLADAIAAPFSEPMDQQGAAPAPGIEHIREKLQAIRISAQNAGLIPAAKSASARQESMALTEESKSAATPVSDSSAAGILPSLSQFRIAPALQQAVRLAVNSPISRPPSSTPFLTPGGSLTERLQSFMPWVQSIAPCEDILLVDDHGDLLWGGSSRADLALSVILAAGADRQNGSDALTRSSVFIRSRLGEQKELSVLPCPTRYGMVTLALLNATGLSNDNVACLREALKLCVDGSAAAPGDQ